MMAGRANTAARLRNWSGAELGKTIGMMALVCLALIAPGPADGPSDYARQIEIRDKGALPNLKKRPMTLLWTP